MENPNLAAYERDRAADERDQVADRREHVEDRREAWQTERERSADRAAEDRDRAADDRDRAADERDRAADDRDRAADDRDRAADERDRVTDNPHYLPPTKSEMGTDHGWVSLTDGELRVVAAVAQGMSNRGIAKKLQLSRHTVDAHLKHVYLKLDIHTRVQLTVLSLQHSA